MIDRFGPGENAGYPTLCKGRFEVNGKIEHALEQPTSLNTLDILPQLKEAGVAAIKIEGRQRSPAYVSAVADIWRRAIDSLQNGNYGVSDKDKAQLTEFSEGSQTTIGAYQRAWQ